MRNLKKVLALVLSLVMALSMVTIASAYEATPGTAYPDDADITEFDEAIQVLNGLGVLQGRDDGRLDPNTAINRAEAATLIYRAVTGDVDGSDLPMFADNALSDVEETDWFSGAVNYCVNNRIVKGRDDGRFDPYAKVTGYEMVAMMLRAIGYDNGNGFSGATWDDETAWFGGLTGITNGFNNAALAKAATRGVVSEIIFRSIALTSQVTSNALGSNQPRNITLAYEIFGLYGDPRVTGMVTDIDHDNDPSTLTPGHIAMDTRAPLTGVARYETDDLALMTNRLPARPDLAVEGYGAPVAIWYLDTTKNGAGATTTSTIGDLGSQIRANNTADTGNEAEIHVYFAPIAAYTTAVTVDQIYNDARNNGAANRTIELPTGNQTVTYPAIIDDGRTGQAAAGSTTMDTLHVDGLPVVLDFSTVSLTDNADTTVDATTGDTTMTGAGNTEPVVTMGDLDGLTANTRAAHHVYGSGKGVHTDLYFVDGELFMTMKNVYAGTISTTLSGNYVLLGTGTAGDANPANNPLWLTNPAVAAFGRVYDVDGVTSGIARNTVITYSVKNALSLALVERTRLVGTGDLNDASTDVSTQAIDVVDIKVAGVHNVEVSNSYINANINAQYSVDVDNYETVGNTNQQTNGVQGNEDTEVSWFIGNGRTWEYNKTYGSTLTDTSTATIANKFGDTVVGTTGKQSANFPTEGGDANSDRQPVLSAASSKLLDLLLDREELLATNMTAQVVYTDECGYVVSTAPGSVEEDSGYIALRYGSYAQQGYDNMWYVHYTGYGIDGELLELDGGYKKSYFMTQREATDAAAAEIGLYWYERDINGKYILETVGAEMDGTTWDTTAAPIKDLNTRINPNVMEGLLYDGVPAGDGATPVGGGTYGTADDDLVIGIRDGAVIHYEDMRGQTIMAGDADAIDNTETSGTELLDDNTRFIIAEYDRFGVITGWKTDVVGYRNIPDMVDGEYESYVISDPTDAAYKQIPFEVYYTTDSANRVDMVVVLGARYTDDPVGAATGDDMFYLLDISPDELVDLYDTHEVLVKGQTVKMQTIKGLVQETVANEGMENYTGLYKIVRRAGNLVAGVEPVNLIDGIGWSAPGVLRAGGTTSAPDLGDSNGIFAPGNVTGDNSGNWVDDWNERGTAVEDRDHNTNSTNPNNTFGYIPYAENCTFWAISSSTGTVTQFSIGSTGHGFLNGTNDGYVAAADAHGFATVVYVVVP